MSEICTLRWTSSYAATRDGLQELNFDWKMYKSLAYTFGTGLFKVSCRGTRGMWLLERIVLGGRMNVGQGLIRTYEATGALAWKF